MSAAICVEESASPGTGSASAAPTFAATLARHGLWPLVRRRVTTLQVNVGRLCNLACHHCHVEAGPRRTEIMAHHVAERVVELLDLNPYVQVLDLTGGTPEMNPSFRFLVTEVRRRGRHVIDRCNLTIFLEDGYRDLPEFLAAHEVQIVASLPCYQKENVDRQRGRGVFDGSIEVLERLNSLGYGRPGSPLRLDLVYNPLGASLPPLQAKLEAQYRHELAHLFGIEFHRLLTITNMPIKRFAAMLARTNQQEAYAGLLVNHFNSATVPELMCRSLVSVGWEGQLYDCDFNQMLEIPLGAGVPSQRGAPDAAAALETPQRAGDPGAAIGARTIWDIDSFDALERQRIATGRHCFGCTAGSGSSCSGALA